MLEHVVHIPVTGVRPEPIWRWMVMMTDTKYRHWHPDHRSYGVVRPADGLLGMRVHFDEILENRFRINMRWEIVESEPPRTRRLPGPDPVPGPPRAPIDAHCRRNHRTTSFGDRRLFLASPNARPADRSIDLHSGSVGQCSSGAHAEFKNLEQPAGSQRRGVSKFLDEQSAGTMHSRFDALGSHAQ